jgi:light-regulated signal transduction histidine kinase (bacteriophytochrome)
MKDNQEHVSKGDILIVDDTPDNLRLLSAILTKRGFEVRKALNGQRAIASIEAVTPDLVLLDIRMPDMNGYEVCQCLKANPQTQDVPIIFISALDDALDKVKAFTVGGIDYITKPFQEAEVLARIENQLRIQDLQRQLIAQNEELARSNRELEQFAYVVSHDLQQPLQSVTGFAKLLTMKYEGSLDQTAVEYLNRIHESGSRMQRLIQDLLEYARVGKQGQDFAVVDCNQILKQVTENLHQAIAEGQAHLIYDELPIVLGNEIQLIQLFQNLIGNAIKFMRPHVAAEIKISAVKRETEWLFGVHDNGIGMEAQCLDRIFEIFQRLNSTKQYAGTGIGLATCKKIVEHHGGRIWAESALNVGTTFYFTLRDV